ncbi:MAG: LysE family translocator [Hyphomicrobium sp.]|jgi:threonine/homoserine/homoserine lactone efflux protein
MTDALTFVLGSLTLLATPGPTNTLLATSGAVSGFRHSLKLLAGELGGYLTAIALLLVVVGPVVAAVPAFGIALRIAVCIYLVHLALMFWQHSAAPLTTAQPVTLSRVFVTTLLNPKAVIFAFTLLPFGPAAALPGMLPWLAALCAMIVIVGGSWIALGASMHRRADAAGHVRAYRVAAVALVLIVVMIGWNTVALAWS